MYVKKITEEKFLKNSISTLNLVSNKHIPITITRKNSESLVIMSLKGYEAIETLLSIIDLLHNLNYLAPNYIFQL
jgi:PHD/YefM family antitoxin component YafN of YafNO toxin-antitoxin module